jgi:hypothetical protein
MGRQFKTPPSNEGAAAINVLTRGSSTVATIPNYGITVLTTDLGTDFVLAPPVAGCRKTLIMNQGTTGVLVRANVAGSTGIIFGSTGPTVIEFDAAGDKSVDLVGINTTQWHITGVRPVSTAIVIAAS